MSTLTTEQQQALTKELTALIEEQAKEEIEQIAKTLAEADDAHLFGQTEFTIRDLVHKIAQKAYKARLAQKKISATNKAASPAPTAITPLATTAKDVAEPS